MLYDVHCLLQGEKGAPGDGGAGGPPVRLCILSLYIAQYLIMLWVEIKFLQHKLYILIVLETYVPFGQFEGVHSGDLRWSFSWRAIAMLFDLLA